MTSLFDGIREANLKRETLRDASDALTKYKMHGDGIYLLRAFVAWRKATAEELAERRRAIIAEIEDPAGNTAVSFESLTSELLSQNILESLDFVINDLLAFCDDTIETNEQLTLLRDALRIGKFHAPTDSATKDAKQKYIAAWIVQYAELERNSTYISENAIAKRVAEKFHISSKTALSHWRGFLKNQPQQAKWVALLVERAKQRKRSNIKVRSTSLRKVTKPKSWK